MLQCHTSVYNVSPSPEANLQGVLCVLTPSHWFDPSFNVALTFHNNLIDVSGLDKSGVRTPGTTRKTFWATRIRGLVARQTTC